MTEKTNQDEKRPYKHLGDAELMDEIDGQKYVVDDLIKFAQIVNPDTWPSIETHEGLYYAFARLRGLTEELSDRFYEKIHIEKTANQT